MHPTDRWVRTGKAQHLSERSRCAGSGGVLRSCVLVSSVAFTSCGNARARSTLAGSGNLEWADAALAPVVHGHGLAAKSSLDERAGRADEPYSQRGDCSAHHYDSHHQLRQHMQIFLDAYNFAKRLKPRDA